MRPLTIRLLSVRRSLPLFLAIVVCLALWQVWLTWRLMDQDRNLARQRARERLEQIADLGLAHLSSTLGEWDLGLRELERVPPPANLTARLPRDATVVLIGHESVTTYPRRPLLFVPQPPGGVPLSSLFDEAEKLEFRDQNYIGAIDALRPLADRPATRAESLLRISRLNRRLNRLESAIANYDLMSVENGVNSDGIPYGLLAMGGRSELQPAASSQLRAALIEARWPLRRETFEYYWAEANRLGGVAEDPPKESLEFSSRVSRLHEQWRRAVDTGTSFSGREAQPDGSLLMWHAARSRLAAIVAPTGWLGPALKLPGSAADVRWRLSGAVLPSDGGQDVHISLADAQLAGRLEFYGTAQVANDGLHRALWLAGVALMLLLVLGGTYAMFRGVSRELRVARLQSDFVSAVSHEFRSPLTSLRGISELLVCGRLTSEARRQQSYVFLDRETGRLQRLVEDLLDFGRMESGRKQCRIERHDVFSLVRGAVAEFREDAARNGFEIEMNFDERTATIEADEGALRRAIRNLLENAVKYSPGRHTVWVDGKVNHGEVAISVRDRGMGIEPREHRDIFQKFVRGGAAKKAGIKGTGIGLSMVRQIVEACGGRIRLESEEGAGSTFTIILPLAGTGKEEALV